MKKSSTKRSVFVQIVSNFFVIEQPDDQIDRWHLGGDLAGWLCSKILPMEKIFYHLGPTMEDWGWIVGFVSNDTILWIKIWAPREVRNQWTIELITEQKKTLFHRKYEDEAGALNYMVRNLKEMFQNTDLVETVEWFDENPLS